MSKLLLAVAIAAMLVGASPAEAQTYDLIMRNARIVDGTGSPWYRADIAIRGDTIARISPSITDPAARVIELGDVVVAPGFIDLHTHAGRNIFQVPTADNYIRQGVTTIMEGADGAGSAIATIAGAPPAPLKPFLDRLDALPKSINIGSFVGQGAVREAVIGLANRPATPAELDRMRALVLQSMRDGAFGLSTGLFYVPGAFTPLEEIVELQKIVAPFRGVHTSHIRDEAADVVGSVKETIVMGEQAGVPTHVSHHKMIGQANWGKSIDTLKLVDAARSRGIDVTMDQYPYTATLTGIHAALLPAWAQEGGLKDTIGRLLDPAMRAKIKTATTDLLLNERGGGDPSNVMIAQCEWDASLSGKNLAELTQTRGLPPTAENAAEIALSIMENGACSGVFHVLSEDDVQRIIAHPATMIASDGNVPIIGHGVPHPRSYGTFARILAVYVREKGVITLEEAVRKMSSFPAARLGLSDRGILRPGMKADIAVFDPARVRDKATYEQPHQYAAGFAYVIVNGQIVYENGAMTSARPGRVIYGPGKTSSVQ
jgi:N-acyl-D-amino-acid deacylase